eukprot:10130535-Prorocentrum_lima.AAC.1
MHTCSHSGTSPLRAPCSDLAEQQPPHDYRLLCCDPGAHWHCRCWVAGGLQAEGLEMTALGG